MRKLLSVIIAVVLTLSGMSCTFAATNENTDFCLKIVHTNDIHARVEENADSDIIGLPKLKTFMDNYTSDCDMQLRLDSGDIYHGQSIATLVKGKSVAELVKACGYDAMTVGNHDWSYGSAQLKELEKISDCRILAGNVVDERGNQFFENPYYVARNQKDGKQLSVGVFGMIDPKIYNATAPSNLTGLSFGDMQTYAKQAVSDLKGMGCNIIICLAHCYNPVSLAKSIDGVDLWLTGHEHTDIDETVTTPDGSQTKVIENGYYLYEAGLIELDCSVNQNSDIENINYKTSSATYDTTATLPEDSGVKAKLEQIKKDESKVLDEVVGKSPSDLDGVWEHIRIDETQLGRAVTDAYLLETGADVAFENAGGIRASINKGNVTYGDIINVSPYGNYIVTKKVTGKQLLEMLETSIDIQINCIEANNSGIYDAWPQNSGSYLQVGGMTVKYDMSQPKSKRISSAKVGNNPLESDKLYTVAINNYTAISSDYPQLANTDIVGEYCACDEALTSYFQQSDDVILNSVNTARMILSETDQETTENNTEETTASSAISTTSAQTTTAISESTNNTTKAAATSDTATNSQNGTVQTGSSAMSATVLLLLLLLACAGGYMFYKKTDITQ